MCVNVRCACCDTGGSSAPGGLLGLAVAAVAAVGVLAAAYVGGWLVWVALVAAGVGLTWATRGAALIYAGLYGWRWLSGARMVGGGYAPARFRNAAAPPVRGPGRFGLPRVNWAWWPGWQRAVVRWAATAVAVAGVVWPLATAAVLGVLVAGTVGAAVLVRRRVWVGASPRRVKLLSGVPVRPRAVGAVPDAVCWQRDVVDAEVVR